MKAFIRRVTSALFEIDDLVVRKISEGLLLLLGDANKDTERDVEYAVEKIQNLWIFPDKAGKMNRSLKDVG